MTCNVENITDFHQILALINDLIIKSQQIID
jgi:hypothetical protein